MLHESKRANVFDSDEREAVELFAPQIGPILAAVRETLAADRAKAAARDAGPSSYCSLVGASSVMRKLYARLEPLASSPSTVLVMGERGSGKELVARALHQGGSRKAAPFIAANVATFQPTLIDSELFGRVKDAYTGAAEATPGLFRAAKDGTLFLDEIGELTLELQAKLLRVLQEKRVRPVGGEDEKKVRARIVLATNRDLAALVAEGKFRADLYDRLTIRIEVPPLRARKEDIPLLVAHLLPRLAAEQMRPVPRFSDATLEALAARDYPGNIRELEQVLLHHILFGEPPVAEPVRPRAVRKRKLLREITREEIVAAIKAAKGNKLQAAKDLDLPRATLYRRLEEESD